MLFPKREGLENQTPIVRFLLLGKGFFLRLQRFRSCATFVYVLGTLIVEFLFDKPDTPCMSKCVERSSTHFET